MTAKSHHMDAKQGLTLVLGGTGKTGRRVAERLLARGVPTRIASRSTVPAFDWNDQDTWEDTLQGVSAVYISYAPDLAIPGAADAIRRFVDMADAQAVRRLVLLSGRGEEEAQVCERIVQAADAEWTIVRASWFFQNFSEGEFLGMIQDGVIALPAEDVPEPFIDADDIADVAVAALTEEGHAFETYEVTGPRMLTFTELAREISHAAGHEVKFAQVTKESFNKALSGAPDALIWLLNYLFDTILDGRNAYLGDGVQRALGREPADFAEFARNAASSGAWTKKDRVA